MIERHNTANWKQFESIDAHQSKFHVLPIKKRYQLVNLNVTGFQMLQNPGMTEAIVAHLTNLQSNDNIVWDKSIIDKITFYIFLSMIWNSDIFIH